jgi:hypothetical protein
MINDRIFQNTGLSQDTLFPVTMLEGALSIYPVSSVFALSIISGKNYLSFYLGKLLEQSFR